jgi:hypothetical protein
MFPPHLHKPVRPSSPSYNPLLRKKIARLVGDLLPYKKSSGISLQIATTPDELESPIPMDATPISTL